MTDALVTTDFQDGIVDIRLNRGGKHNSLTLEMFEAIASAGESLHANADARVAVLSGAGPSFCAGLDLSVMKTFLSPNKEEVARTLSLLGRKDGPENLAQRVGYIWHTAPVPVITPQPISDAEVSGTSFGIGMHWFSETMVSCTNAPRFAKLYSSWSPSA